MSQTHLRYFDGMLRSRWLKSRGRQLITIHHLYFTAGRQRARVLTEDARASTVMKNGISQNCRLGGIKAVRRRQLIAARKGLLLSEYPGWFGSDIRFYVFASLKPRRRRCEKRNKRVKRIFPLDIIERKNRRRSAAGLEGCFPFEE